MALAHSLSSSLLSSSLCNYCHATLPSSSISLSLHQGGALSVCLSLSTSSQSHLSSFPSPAGPWQSSLSSSSPSSESPPPSTSSSASSPPSSAEYNERMTLLMANPYEYQHALGMYFTPITPHLLVGSQPQTPADITRLRADHDVAAVLSLQQDADVLHWGVDPSAIRAKCAELGVRHYRRPARDFDPHSLRQVLPSIVAVIDRYVREQKTVYVHCTAGLGRAPGAAIAYLFWFVDMDMNAAYEYLTARRPCGPKREAIRGATYDLAKNSEWQPPLEHLPDFAFTDVADWERRLIQERVRSLYYS